MVLNEIARITTRGVRSLVWAGDELVDWVAGGRRFRLDGTMIDRTVNYSYRFDAACQSPSNVYAVIYERLGTKGLVLHRGEILREINRSFYNAAAYEYPVTIGVLPDQREVLVHCPEHYNQIEIDDLATGECLTKRDDRKPSDFFHSRLALSASGSWLLSAGWVWHPCDMIALFSIAEVLQDSRNLDSAEAILQFGSEVSSAAFLDDDQLVVATSEETFFGEEDFEDPKYLRPQSLAVWSCAQQRIVSRVKFPGLVGTMLPIEGRHVIGFFDFPKVIDLTTGEVVASLPEIKTGKQTSSIIHHMEALPPLAIDSVRKRFAVVNDQVIHVFAAE